MARVAVIFTGGTISMRPDAAAGGNVPVLDGAAILALAPEVGSVADVVAIDWGMVPASHLKFADMLSIARRVDEQARRADIDGVVVVQGTDTIEETSFAFDLLVATDKPIVITGAMRDASSPVYDGPRNLADAVRVAAAPTMVGCGAVVVLAGAVVAADVVVKKDTTAMDTFQPRDGEPVAHIVGNQVALAAARDPRRVLPAIPRQAVEDVHLVTATAGMDGSLVRAIARLHPRGLVVAATGTGNTHPDLLAAATELAADGTVLALTTRCPTGTVSPTYAFPGGGATWQRAGALLSIYDGPKTRVALALGLAAGLDTSALAALIGHLDRA
jgi:L-asparaginase